MARVPTQSAAEGFLYCATCPRSDGDFGPAREGAIGIRFTCPNDRQPDNPSHIAAVVKDEPGRLWLCIAANLFLAYERHGSAWRWFNCWGGWLEGRIGQYLTIRFGFLIAALVAARVVVQGSVGNSCLAILLVGIATLVALYVIIDTLLVNTSVAFVSRNPAHPLRTLVFAVYALSQLGLAFAVFYALLGQQFKPPLNWVRAVYFSLGTLTTAGSSEIGPREYAWAPQLLTVFELLVGLYFLAVVVAIFASWATGEPKPDTYEPIEQLRKR